MNEVVPTSAGWYPDVASGGTTYWDGKRWTGDTRPRRKSFAAASKPDDWSLYFLFVGVPLLPILAFIAPDESVTQPVLWLLAGIVLLAAYVAIGVYLFRGQGPSTRSIERRLALDEKAAKSRRRSANVAGFVAGLGRIGRAQQTAAQMGSDTAAAQIEAIANPETARALQNLQNLLYTRAISDAEYQAAKDKLLGAGELNDAFAQVAKLAELHRDGVLGDLEFSAAKARVLGL